MHLADQSHGGSGMPLGSVCYTSAEQDRVLRQAQTCYFALLTTAQMAHVWLCKARTASVWRHGIFRNDMTIWGVIIEACLIIAIIFPPFMNDFLTSHPFPPKFWALTLVAPAALFLWQEGRKLYVQRHPHSFIARYIHW